jgi:RNA polymerase sigma factor (sigma-70 family)
MGSPEAESNGRSEHTEALYREHGAAVAGLCRSLLRDRSEAEDATQQVFLSAHRALLNGAVPREPLAWLLAVARNECYARFRRRAAAPVPSDEAPEGAAADASVHVLRAGELASFWDEVGRLPPAQREAFLLREIRGLSYGQLAAELSLSRPSVRSLLLRARTRLRHRLGDLAAGVGGVPWVQALLRLAAGGDGTSPMPAATKAVAVGIGALALAGGGDLPRAVHHSSAAPVRAAVGHRVAAHVRRVAAPVAVVAVPREDRAGLEHGSPGHASGSGDGSRGSGSGRSGSGGGDGSGGSTSGGGSQGGGGDGAPATAPVVPQTTSGDGHDGGGGTSPGPGSGSAGSPGDGGRDGSGDTTTAFAQAGSDDGGGQSGSDSGSDGGSASVTTTTASGSDGGSGSAGSGDSGSSGSSSDGGGGSDGGSDGG